jgi:hypothetical protein
MSCQNFTYINTHTKQIHRLFVALGIESPRCQITDPFKIRTLYKLNCFFLL